MDAAIALLFLGAFAFGLWLKFTPYDEQAATLNREWKFTVRTLLITTTLIAMVLGTVVCTVR